MQDFEPKDLPENDRIEISDLDTPNEQGKLTWLQHIIKFVEARLSSRTRTTLFTLLLFLGTFTLIYSIISYLHIPIIQAIHAPTPTPSIRFTIGSDITIESVSPNNLSVVNGVAYISTPDGTLSAQQANDGTFLWQTKTAVPLSPPIVANNTIYITSQNSLGGHVDAFRASDGNLQWSYQTGSLASQPLLVEDGIVYVDTGTGVLHALRASDGKLLWHFTIGNPTNGASSRLETLLSTADGVTVIHTYDQIVYFLRSQDGSQLWHYPVDSNTPAPTIENGIAYINDHSLQARRLNDGKLLWQYATGDVQSSIIQHNIIYLNIGNLTVLTLNAQNGSRVWQYQAHQPINTLNAQNGMVFITMVDGTATILKDQTGSLLWQFKLPTGSDIFWLSGAKDEVLYVGVNESVTTIYALQTNNGHILWQQSMQNSNQSYNPRVNNGLTYAKQVEGYINAWDSNDGHLTWHYPSSASIAWNIIKTNDLVYLQQPDGSILALHIQDGKVAWRYPTD